MLCHKGDTAYSEKSFKAKHTLETRKRFVEQCPQTEGGKSPVIISLAEDTMKDARFRGVDHVQFYVENSKSVSALFGPLRDRFQMNPDETASFFCQQRYLLHSKLWFESDTKIGDLYTQKRDKEDGLLYITFSVIPTMG